MSTTTATFANAELACKNQGGRLPSWTSGEKQVGRWGFVFWACVPATPPPDPIPPFHHCRASVPYLQLQLAIESYFKATAKLTTSMGYWLGLYRAGARQSSGRISCRASPHFAGWHAPAPLSAAGSFFYWADKTWAGNGEVSEANPYAHWWVSVGEPMLVAGSSPASDAGG
jgi:hypothetical protein